MLARTNHQFIATCFVFAAVLVISGRADVLKLGNGRPNIMVILQSYVDDVAQQVGLNNFPTREARITAFTKALQSASQISQANVLALCKTMNATTKSFWITNQISVKNASPQLIAALSKHKDVLSVQNDMRIPVPWNEGPFSEVNSTNFMLRDSDGDHVQWNIRKIGADKVWAQGVTGETVKIAVIDTGVRGTHVTLRNNYVGDVNYGWFDAIHRTKQPIDRNGHGTLVTGIICGKNGIGVAPGAKWMACRAGINDFYNSDLIECGQWILCPHDTDGNNADCSKAPHIVSNSYGSVSPGQTFFNDVINAWNKAGIIPIFAIGNGGPNCGSLSSPGDQPGVISVGSSNTNDQISTFSSRGLRDTSNHNISPFIVAPGETVWSASHKDDNSYSYHYGTSLAAPHVAGAAALLQYSGAKEQNEILRFLLATTSNQNLGGVAESPCANGHKYPNNVAGHGRLDVFKAFNKLVGSKR